MADVNEEIIEQYLKLIKKWFYISDISFKVPNNYSNIDLLAFDPINKKYYDIEVKYRSRYTISANSKKGIDTSFENVLEFTKQFSDYEERGKKIKEFTGREKVTKVLIATKQLFGKTENKRRQIEKSFKKQMTKCGFYRSEIWYFDDIIPEIYNSVELNGRYNTELIQTIRMIKTYNKK